MARRSTQSRAPQKADEKPAHLCAWAGCDAPAAFKAPKSRNQLGTNRSEDYQYFCEAHIREFNRNWDYFKGMSREEIEAFQMGAIHGHRPTWATTERVAGNRFTEEQLHEAFARFQGHKRYKRTHQKTEWQELSEDEIKAFAALDLEPNASLSEIKQRYKSLVKQLHPDVNNGDKESEERFKIVTAAYHELQAYLKRINTQTE